MYAIARLSTARPIAVILAWVTLVIGLQAATLATGTDLRDVNGLDGTDSQQAHDLLGGRFPALAGEADTFVVAVDSGQVTDPAVVAEVEKLLTEIGSIPSVASVASPYDAPGQISADGTVAFARVTYDALAYDLPIADIEAVADIATAADGTQAGAATLTVGHGGQPASRLANPEVGIGEIVGLIAAAVILVVAFGSLVAMTVPLASALIALAGATATIGMLSSLSPITSSAPTLAVLLGMGIGIDYALFIVNRHRNNLKAGRDLRDSIRASITTSGRAIVFAGATVFIALTGMFVPQIAFLSGLATAAAVTVVFSVAASVTLVPALLTLYGHRVLNRRERDALAQGAIAPTSAPVEPGRFARLVERRPLVTGVAAVAFLAVLAIPALDMRMGTADQGNDPDGSPTRVAYELIADGFGPGANGPLLVTVDLGAAAPLDPAAPPTALVALGDKLAADASVDRVVGPIPNAALDAVVFQVVPLGSPQDVDTEQLVERVRDDYAPAADAAGLETHVGGSVAATGDFSDAITRALPVFFAIVVGLAMVVLMIAFRSVTLPVVGAVLNLMSAAASFGVVTAVFQWGWGHQLIGLGDGGPIEPFAPMILFALLFGLSMDYQVFLVSRIAELWHSGRDNAAAVRRGLADVSRVIIAAASIMIVVFGSFVTSESRVLKLLGLGLAFAIFVDAFVIRVVLMPAIMRLLGRWNWWMPTWLDRVVPHLDIDGNELAAAPASVEARSGRSAAV